MTKNIELFQKGNGFYAGRELKNGQMAMGAHRITDEEIMTMFTSLFERYTKETGETKLLMKDSKGDLFAATKIDLQEK